MDIGMLIDGADRPAADGASFERLDPFTGKTATRGAVEPAWPMSRPRWLPLPRPFRHGRRPGRASGARC